MDNKSDFRGYHMKYFLIFSHKDDQRYGQFKGLNVRGI